jgi:hypothetical protein
MVGMAKIHEKLGQNLMDLSTVYGYFLVELFYEIYIS